MIHRFQDNANTPRTNSSINSHQSFRSDVEQAHTPMQIYDPESADIVYASRLAMEMINISGAQVIVYARTHHNGFDETWEADADPTYMSGKKFKAFFVPQAIAQQLTQWGADAPNKTTIVFNREDVLKSFGNRMIHNGDVIEVPYNSATLKLGKYRVTNAFDSGNFKYTFLYFSCFVENLTDDITVSVDHK